MPYDLPAMSRSRGSFLARRGTLVLDGARGTTIAVDHGCLWVTLESDPRDLVLVAGMRFKIDRDGRTIIAAEEDSQLRLIRGRTTAERTGAWLARKLARVFRRFVARRPPAPVPYY
jgi:hypothetical protein